jgi:hypothetical protein
MYILSHVYPGRRKSQWYSGELEEVYVGVRGSPTDQRLVMVQKSSSASLCEGWSGEGVPWRSPPSSTAVWGRSSVNVFVIHCRTSLYVLFP